jgi:hypothetical protein
MAKHKVVPIKDGDPLSKRLKTGTIVACSDGWRGRVHYDDGKSVTMIRDGDQMNSTFKGHRSFMRSSVKLGSFKIVGRGPVVDLAARKMLSCTVSVIDRARLEAEWESAPE